MTPDQFKEAAQIALGRKSIGSNTEIEVGQMREILGLMGRTSGPRVEWAEANGLRVVATRAARKGLNAWVRVGDVCAVLEDKDSPLSRSVRKSRALRALRAARTNGHHVRKSDGAASAARGATETYTYSDGVSYVDVQRERRSLDETPQIEVSELYEGTAAPQHMPATAQMAQTDAVALRNIGMRLDDMTARLNNLQQCVKANALRLRRIDRKINAMLKAWGIEDTPTEQDALEAALTELVNDGKED